eukprot:6188659-Pleurochrysis_carterae.AAC.2
MLWGEGSRVCACQRRRRCCAAERADTVKSRCSCTTSLSSRGHVHVALWFHALFHAFIFLRLSLPQFGWHLRDFPTPLCCRTCRDLPQPPMRVFDQLYGPLDRPTGARNRHNAPFWALAARRSAKALNIAAGSLNDLCWDLVDAASVARGVVAILFSPKTPRRRVYEFALGRTISFAELLSAAFGTDEVEQLISSGKVKLLSDLEAAKLKGRVQLHALPPGHWLYSAPFQVSEAEIELGWQPTDFKTAMREYDEWLDAEERSLAKAKSKECTEANTGDSRAGDALEHAACDK